MVFIKVFKGKDLFSPDFLDVVSEAVNDVVSVIGDTITFVEIEGLDLHPSSQSSSHFLEPFFTMTCKDVLKQCFFFLLMLLLLRGYLGVVVFDVLFAVFFRSPSILHDVLLSSISEKTSISGMRKSSIIRFSLSCKTSSRQD